MSTTNEPTRRMSTRAGARDKMAKVMERLCSGGIAEEDSNLKGGAGEDTAAALVNDEEEKGEDAQLSKRKTANRPKAAKRKTSKKASTLAAKKPKTSKGVDTAAQGAVVSKLAELEDRYQKKYEDARLSHPRHWTGEAPGSSRIFDSLTDRQPANCLSTEQHSTVVAGVSTSNNVCTGSSGQSVMNSNVGNCDSDKLNALQVDGDSSPSPGSENETTYAADKTIEVNASEDAPGEPESESTIPSRQRNIAEKKCLNAVCAESQTRAKASRPKPRRVQPQLKGSGIASQAGGKMLALIRDTSTQNGAKVTAIGSVHQNPTDAGEAESQDTTKKKVSKSNVPPILAPPHTYHDGNPDVLDSDQSSASGRKTNASGEDSESDIDMEVVDPEPEPVKAWKTKTKGAKGKKKVTMPELRDEIRAIRKVPNLETGLGGVQIGGPSRDQTFETPAVKKNITNQIEEWAQRLPPLPLKKQRTSATRSQATRDSRSVSSANVNLNPIMKTAIPTTVTTTKSTSCAIVVDSTTEVLRKKPAPGTKRQAHDLESAGDTDDEGTFSNLFYEGLGEDEPEDDTLEQADAVSSPVKAPVAAQMSKKSLNIYHGITLPVKEKRSFKRQGNKQLPSGALDNGRWSTTFIPTFLLYVSITNKDVWTLKLQDTITALQAIWNEVYKGSVPDHQKKIKHLVQQASAVHDVSVQRITDWRCSIGSNGLTVVGDFMDSSGMDTTEKWKEAAKYLLDHKRYIYLKIRDDENDVVKRSGRYRGPLVVQTMAQCLIDFEGAIEVPGFVDPDDFPCAALVLSATSVHRALWLWADGYITKESHDSGKLTKSNGIMKVRGQDGKFTKATNFSKDQWDAISDMHMRDVQAIEPEKLRVLEGDIQASVNVLRRRRVVKKSKEGSEANQLDKKARGSGYQHRIAWSDSDV